MDEQRFSRRDRPIEGREQLGACESIQFLMRAEEKILHSISAGMPQSELLNRICRALDCEIGNVVSLVSLLDDDATDFAAIAGNAKHFGLHQFCSMGVIAENRALLGTLEMYSCEPGPPSPRELELIERAACLAAIAIERENGAIQDARAVVVELRPVRERAMDWQLTTN
jgi:hypothetical protein